MKVEKLLLTVVTVMFMGLSTNVLAKDNTPIQRGMTKEEVMKILGKPENMSFNQYGELWEYYKKGWPLHYDKRVTIGFSANGEVVSYNSVTLRPDNETHNIKVESAGAMPPLPPQLYPPMDCYMTDGAFNVLYSKVKGAPFDDNKFDLIEVASLSSYYSCSQCATIMNLFTFGDEKLKALRYMSPHIVDPQNADLIYKTLGFESEREEAARIIKGL